MQNGPDMIGVGQIERYSRHKHAVEEAFKHGGRPKGPCWKLQHKGIRRQKAADIWFQSLPVAARVMVTPPRFRVQYGIEALSIKVQQVNRMFRLPQTLQGAIENGGMKAFRQGMTVNI